MGIGREKCLSFQSTFVQSKQKEKCSFDLLKKDMLKCLTGQSGQLPTQVLAEQLTLYQPEGADCTPHITKYLPIQLPTYSPAGHVKRKNLHVSGR